MQLAEQVGESRWLYTIITPLRVTVRAASAGREDAWVTIAGRRRGPAHVPTLSQLLRAYNHELHVASDRISAAMLRPLALPLCLLLLACSGNDTPVPAVSPKSAGTPATDKSVVQPTTKSAAEPTDPSAGEATEAAAHARRWWHAHRARPWSHDPGLVQARHLPRGHRRQLGPHAEGRPGPLRETQMLLSLPAGTTHEACVDALRKAASPAVPNLQQTEKDGRVNLTGGNDDYAVTMLCGEGKGKMSAYLSYRCGCVPRPRSRRRSARESATAVESPARPGGPPPAADTCPLPTLAPAALLAPAVLLLGELLAPGLLRFALIGACPSGAKRSGASPTSLTWCPSASCSHCKMLALRNGAGVSSMRFSICIKTESSCAAACAR